MHETLREKRDDIDQSTAARHPPITLDPWQYRLTATPHPDALDIGGFWLSVGDGLPQVVVSDETGQPAGLLLGFAIDLQKGAIIRDSWTAPSGADLKTDRGIYETLRALGGQYVWIYRHDGRARLYPDAAAQVTCVWDAETQTAGSTSTAILDDANYEDRFDPALFTRMGIVGEGWFPAGLTAHSGVSRLLPNHYLDLTTWSAQRIDKTCDFGPHFTTRQVTEGVISAIQTQLTALLNAPEKPVIALTAGRETRAMLACARPWVEQLYCVTVTGEDRHQTDTVVAKKIAADFGLSHICLPRQTADQPNQDIFLRRGGHCFGDSNMRYHVSMRTLAPDHVFIGGLGGEIGRAFYWEPNDRADTAVTPELLLARLGLPKERIVIDRLQNWCAGLPQGLNAQQVLDLAYLELRMGPWARAQFCCDPTLVRYAPMITYDTVQMMHALPSLWKTESRLNEAIVERLWPALNEYSYNTLGPMRDIWVRIQRLLKNPVILRQKLHNLFA